MAFSAEQIEALKAPLDPKHVKDAPQGKYGQYVEGYHVVSEANRIFGYDGWSYSIAMLEQCSRTETKDRNGNDQVRVGYRCTVRASVAGVYREGAAVGTGMAKPENEADAHESAVKEAETDALKRALRSFGNTFGLALYDTEKTNVRAALITDAQRDEITLMAEGAGISLQRICRAEGVESLKDLPASKFDTVITNLKADLNRPAKKEAA